MPFPVAHALLGASAVVLAGPQGSRRRRAAEIAVGACLGVLPDLDFALNRVMPREDGQSWHHGFTHSFAFAAAGGIVAALVFGRRTARMAVAYALAIGSHPVLDFFLTEGRGPALLWPFTEARYRMGTYGTVYHAIRSGDQGGRFRFRLLIASAIEAAVLLPVLFAAMWWRGGRRRQEIR